MNNEKKIMERNYSLDFLKIIATIIIFFYHYQQVTLARFPGINFYAGQFDFSCMVELFFVLSGYFMFSYEDKIKAGLNFKTFFAKRASRLLPVVAVVAVVFNGANLLYREAFLTNWFSMPITLWSTITTALGISQGWGLPESYVNYPMWYISALLLCYCIFYLINYIAKRLELPTEYMYAVMICIGMGGLTYGMNQVFYTYGTSRGYYAFFFGVLLKKYLNNRKISKRMICGSLAIVIVMAALILFKPTYVTDGIYYLMTFFVYPAIIILMNTDIAKKIFKWKFIGTLSAISYNVYVWHLTLIIILLAVDRLWSLNIVYSNVFLMIGGLIVSYIVGALSHYYIEKPITRYIDKKLFNK